MPPPTPPLPATGAPSTTIMHMTFFWGNNGVILFPGWPGSNWAIYSLALLLIFSLAFLSEYLSHSNIVLKEPGSVAAGLVQTVVHTLRTGLVYLVMLAVMSFNAGVFVVAVAGHALGFMVLGTWVFKKPPIVGDKSSNLAPMICV